MIISIKDESMWRTLTALRESIKFYKANNQDGKYTSALGKEERMLKREMGLIEYELANLAMAA